MHDGKRRMDGEVWPNSSCETCRCRKGVAVCSTMLCPKPPCEWSLHYKEKDRTTNYLISIHILYESPHSRTKGHYQDRFKPMKKTHWMSFAAKCTWVVVPTGECCPVCIGCQTEKMEKKKMNDTWSSDDCTTSVSSHSHSDLSVVEDKIHSHQHLFDIVLTPRNVNMQRKTVYVQPRVSSMSRSQSPFFFFFSLFFLLSSIPVFFPDVHAQNQESRCVRSICADRNATILARWMDSAAPSVMVAFVDGRISTRTHIARIFASLHFNFRVFTFFIQFSKNSTASDN